MIYRQFGNTGIEVSALGMGGMRFERPDDIDDMAEIVLRAHERGVTYFDTAPFYSNDKSEDIHGAAIKEMKKSGRPFRIATKSGSDDPQKVREMCERSLERLGVDVIDFYHVWCVVRPGDLPHRIETGAIDEFRKLKEEGLVRHVCVSTHLEHDNVAPMLDQAEGLFDGMLIGINAMNYDLRTQGAQAAAERGLGVVTMNTLGGGLITSHPEHFDFIRSEGDRSVLEAALRFNLSLPEVTVALAGFRNVEDVDTAIDCVERFRPLPAERIREVRERLIEESDDFCTQCGYCRVCPVDIPVVRLMDAYNHKLLDGEQAALDLLKYHWGVPDVREALKQCMECGKCETACTQHLPIIDRFDELMAAQERREKSA